jgi:hypothetical protein
MNATALKKEIKKLNTELQGEEKSLVMLLERKGRSLLDQIESKSNAATGGNRSSLSIRIYKDQLNDSLRVYITFLANLKSFSKKLNALAINLTIDFAELRSGVKLDFLKSLQYMEEHEIPTITFGHNFSARVDTLTASANQVLRETNDQVWYPVLRGMRTQLEGIISQVKQLMALHTQFRNMLYQTDQS